MQGPPSERDGANASGADARPEGWERLLADVLGDPNDASTPCLFHALARGDGSDGPSSPGHWSRRQLDQWWSAAHHEPCGGEGAPMGWPRGEGPPIDVAQLDALVDAALLVDAAGWIVGTNHRFAELSGHHAASLVGQQIEVVVPARQRQGHREHRRWFAEEGRHRPTHSGLLVHLRHADGHEIPVGVGLTPMTDGNLLAVVRPAGDRAGVEAGLHQRARLLEAVGEAVIATDLEGRIEYWNAAATRLYGWSAEEVLGRDILEVTPTADAVPRGREVRRMLRRGESWSGELRVRDRFGREFPIWGTATPSFDDRGRLVGVVGTATDISELRDAQRQAQRRADQQEAVAHLGRELLDVRDLDAVLDRVCRVVAEVLDVELTKVLELTRDHKRLWLRAGIGWHDGLVGRATVPNSTASQAGFTLTRDEPVVVDHVATEQRFAPPRLLTDHGVASGMSVTIPGEGRSYGVLGVHSRKPRAFTANDTVLLRSVAGVVGAAVDRHEATIDLERLALSDRLTGLANRALLVDRLEQALERAGPRAGRVALLLLDLEGFKLVNNALGRHAGDDLLVEVADRLMLATASLGTVARVGDDEFAVLCEHLADDQRLAGTQALELAGRVNDQVAGHYTLAGEEVYVTIRMGVAVHTGEDAQALLHDAEAANTRARQQGGERITLYEQGVDSGASRHLELVNALRRAYAQDEFFLVYQPELDLRTGGLFGVEALVRWNHPTRGVLAPGEFLDVADGIGLMVPLGARILRRACEQATCLPADSRGASPAMSVNVSAHQLAETDFVEVVEEALDATGLEPRLLILEITEGAIIEDHDRALCALQALRDQGVQIALDDFGTGFSSLTHLHRFPIDQLKIDKSFVGRLDDGGPARTIVEATIALARTLGLICVAEGVETRPQLDDLTQLGCDIGQGYLWSPPLPVAQLGEWLRRHG